MANKIKQSDVVLNWLQTRGELTTRDAVTDLNIMSVAKRVEELRKKGLNITTTYRTTQNGARYGVYTLAE